MVKPNDVYRRVEDKWVSRFIMDEVVIMPLCRSQEDMQYIYSLSNETSSKLWQLLDGSNSVGEIQEALKAEYQGQKEVIEREVLEFIGDVFEAGLVEKAEETKDEGREPTFKSSQSTVENKSPQSTVHSPQLKKAYKTPEIARIKMQPEQAVLSCCLITRDEKQYYEINKCADPSSCRSQWPCGGPSPGVTVWSSLLST